MSQTKYHSWQAIRPMSPATWCALAKAVQATDTPIDAHAAVLAALARRRYALKSKNGYFITPDGVRAHEHYMSSDRARQELTDLQSRPSIGGARERGVKSKVRAYINAWEPSA